MQMRGERIRGSSFTVCMQCSTKDQNEHIKLHIGVCKLVLGLNFHPYVFRLFWDSTSIHMAVNLEQIVLLENSALSCCKSQLSSIISCLFKSPEKKKGKERKKRWGESGLGRADWVQASWPSRARGSSLVPLIRGGWGTPRRLGEGVVQTQTLAAGPNPSRRRLLP